jgi:hypothetical protein
MTLYLKAKDISISIVNKGESNTEENKDKQQHPIASDKEIEEVFSTYNRSF